MQRVIRHRLRSGDVVELHRLDPPEAPGWRAVFVTVDVHHGTVASLELQRDELADLVEALRVVADPNPPAHPSGVIPLRKPAGGREDAS